MDSHIGKREILVVDDDPSMLELLVDVLSSEGFEVRSAANGKLALQSVMTRPPHMILMDINMPDMDGIEVLRRLQALDVNFNIPVIFVSGMAKIDEMAEGLSLGAVDFIPKPYHNDDLLARVRTHLKLI
jgi:DNA-binding response OmpR family regulator